MVKFNHFNFNVLNLEKSLEFYEKALGLKPVREKDDSVRSLSQVSSRVKSLRPSPKYTSLKEPSEASFSLTGLSPRAFS